MTAPSLVRMATIEGAKVLGMGQETGSLEVGKQADLILLDLDRPHLTPLYNPCSHLVYAASGADVDTVFIAGRLVMRRRKLLTLDWEEIRNGSGKSAEELKRGEGMRTEDEGVRRDRGRGGFATNQPPASRDLVFFSIQPAVFSDEAHEPDPAQVFLDQPRRSPGDPHQGLGIAVSDRDHQSPLGGQLV